MPEFADRLGLFLNKAPQDGSERELFSAMKAKSQRFNRLPKLVELEGGPGLPLASGPPSSGKQGVSGLAGEEVESPRRGAEEDSAAGGRFSLGGDSTTSGL